MKNISIPAPLKLRITPWANATRLIVIDTSGMPDDLLLPGIFSPTDLERTVRNE